MTINEAAEKLHKNPTTIRNWIKYGYPLDGGDRLRLKATRFGRAYVISQEQIDEFIKELNARV